MSRIILLDSGPLRMITNPKAEGITLACQVWLKSLLKRGEKCRPGQKFIIPACDEISYIIDYCVKRISLCLFQQICYTYASCYILSLAYNKILKHLLRKKNL